MIYLKNTNLETWIDLEYMGCELTVEWVGLQKSAI